MSTPEHNTESVAIPNDTSPSEHSNSSDIEETPRENHTSDLLKQEQTSTPVLLSTELNPMGKRKRGRPKKNPSEKTNEDGTPKVKRPRGRPKGSKNKNPKAKPILIGPKRPRGRPRKWPPVEKPPPHLRRGRGRPRKDAQLQQTQMNKSLQLPTMVTFTETAHQQQTATTSMESPITESDIGHDLVPPDDLFEIDD